MAFLAEQHAFLQSVQGREDKLMLHLDEVNKLAQELSDRKMELKAAMFNDKLASFVAFPRIDEVTLGELAFTNVQIPFKTLDIANADLNLIDIRAAYDIRQAHRHLQERWYRGGDANRPARSSLRLRQTGALGRATKRGPMWP